MQRGTTLLELLLALVLLGLATALAVPGITRLRDRLAVDAAAQALAGAHTRARLVAVTERRNVLLTLAQDSLIVHAIETPADTVERWRSAGPGAEGVITTGLPRRISYAASGVSLGLANGTYTITRGNARRQVIVSRYGRVRIV
jgi:prepilin-type N-terminal cleavage/methylation domain-containing protein